MKELIVIKSNNRTMQNFKNMEGIKSKTFIYLLFIFLMVSLLLRIIIGNIYLISIFLFVLIFIISQHSDLEYRYFVGFALILSITCLFLLILNYDLLAEYFANYVYGFLLLGLVGYFLDNLRGRLKKKGYFKIYRLIFLSFLILTLISPLIIYREFIPKLPGIIKYMNHYIHKENAVIKTKIEENMIITVENPEEDSEISGMVKISGWAIEGNSRDGSGIDKVEIFVDGKPGIGKHLDLNDTKFRKEDSPAYELVKRFYSQYYDKEPDDETINYWQIKLESGEISIDKIAINFFLSEEFKSRNLNDKEYINILYLSLLNREPDDKGLTYWLDVLNKGTERNAVFYEFLKSVEHKGVCRDYYNKLYKYLEYINVGVNLPREDIGNSYGEQFKNSGFIFNFDSIKFENGEHIIYVYAYSQYFGWDYVSFNIDVKN